LRRQLIKGVDADHPSGDAAIVKETLDGIGQVSAFIQPTKMFLKLGPVGDQLGLAQDRMGGEAILIQPLGFFGEADKGGDGGANALNGFRPLVHLFDVDTRGVVRSRHESFSF
jgi:hypothetical protein